VSATLGGLLYFQDYRKFEAWQWGVFITGDSIAIAAVFMMVRLRMYAEPPETDHDPSSEATPREHLVKIASKNLPMDLKPFCSCCAEGGSLEGLLPLMKEDRLPGDVVLDEWEKIHDFDIFCHRSKELAIGTNSCRICCQCCPGCCRECTWSYSVCAACTFGQLITKQYDEDPIICCGALLPIGRRGCKACMILTPCTLCCAFVPIIAFWSLISAWLTGMQRRRMVVAYSLSNQTYAKAFLCYPCALWKHYIFTNEIQKHLKAQRESTLATPRLGNVTATATVTAAGSYITQTDDNTKHNTETVPGVMTMGDADADLEINV